jgi:Fe-S-cluster-containing dehydrogenase component/anaerobic selenocysteine-containing dehydrogenase
LNDDEPLEPSEGKPGDGEPDGITRRAMLELCGASIALAGAAGCGQNKRDKLLPYAVNPRDMIPGVPLRYATSLSLDGHATGVLVRVNDGRPSKIEGNPDHPASLGATGAMEEASVLGLYDPQRARGILHNTAPATWLGLTAALGKDRPDRGAGLRLLLEPTSSPLLASMLDRVLRRFPGARVTFHSAGRSDAGFLGTKLAFGRPLQAVHELRRAEVILALDADFLATGPFHLRHAQHFAERRRIPAPGAPMSRLYVVEPALSPTGSLADHRLQRRPSDVHGVLAAVIVALAGLPDVALPVPRAALEAALAPAAAREDRALTSAIARDLARHPGAAMVIPGEWQSPETHALAHLCNAMLRSQGLVDLIDPTLVSLGDREQDLPALAREIDAGGVDTLVILEGNPAYSAPADLDLGRLISRIPTTVYLGAHENETAAVSRWFIPARHPLESWGDARAYDGTISLIQALIEPLHEGSSPAEMLALVSGEPHPDARRLLRSLWRERVAYRDFESFWQDTLKLGIVVGSGSPAVIAPFVPGTLLPALAARGAAPPGIEVALRPDSRVYDGRFANNAWLQELPKPLTKLTWDNAALMSPALAARLGVGDEDRVRLSLGERSVEAPVLIAPGHADEAVTLHLGYGRTGAEAVARGVGFNAYRLRTSTARSGAIGLQIAKLGGPRHPLARTQQHWSTEGRPLALRATADEYRKNPDFTAEQRGPTLSLMPPLPGSGAGGPPQWAMTIDLGICTGCGACEQACQAENNIFVVGKEGILKSREMHWLRIDTYYEGPRDEPRVIHEPMLCQHCERAPCEYVCPVNATVHSPDGLNEMVYNRCVGTRFCSNNCPYKVRRFNWFDWEDHAPENQGLVRLQRNPEVTVRQRGVMEKCTFCVQRLRATEIRAKIEGNRLIREGEVTTACAQACPTRAIQFDALHNTGSAMVRRRGEPRNFAVLHELGTQPRVNYLARIDNPNPEIG